MENRMRIAIDLTATPKSKTGIGRYLLGLLEGLQKMDPDNEYFLFVHDDDMDGFGITKDRFHIVPVHSRILRRTWIRILWEQFVFPFRLRKNRIDILHCPNFTMPYGARIFCRGLKIIGTFHDMTYFFLPEFHVGWKREMFKTYIHLTAAGADKILTISENSKKDISKYCSPRNTNISVTCMGVDPRFFSADTPSEELLSKYGIDAPYIFYVGTLEPRKNIAGLITAYRDLPMEVRESCKLVICGKKGWLYDEIYERMKSDEALLSQVIFPGYVEDSDLPSLMHGAKAVAYVSFYEGFGIPVIEGMASGVATITSYGSSLEEVAGDGALLTDPKNPAGITEALAWALSDENREEREALIARGILQAATYTWDRCAKETIAAYQETKGGAVH